MKILALITDAFGGRGGIAKFNRDLLEVLCAYPDAEEVVAAPRLMPPSDNGGEGVAKLRQLSEGANHKVRYVSTLLRHVMRRPGYDLVICGHIHLLPLAWLCHLWTRAPLLLIIHGMEAWQPTGKALADMLAKRVGTFVAVSEVTKGRFMAWTGLPAERGVVLPNSVNLEGFEPGPKSSTLLARYGLEGKTVIMTLGRLDTLQRSKGFDEVMEAIQPLSAEVPDLAYLIVGDGTDRPRLIEKAQRLGVEDRVVFAGYIPEAEKVDHYQLADAYVMASKGEGFGIVYLEAMACGIPVVGSSIDGSRAAIRDERFGLLADPNKPAELQETILAALERPKGVPEGLDYFSSENFSRRVYAILDAMAISGTVGATMDPNEPTRA